MEREDLKEILKRIGRKGIRDAEVYLYEGEVFTIRIKNSSIDSLHIHHPSSLHLRTFYQGGKSKITCSPSAPIEEIVESSVSLAKNTSADPYFRSLPHPRPSLPVEELWDEKVARLQKSEVVSWVKEILQEAKEEEPEIRISGELSLSQNHYFLLNSHGIEFKHSFTHLSLGLYGVLWKGDEAGSFFDFIESHNLEDFSYPGIGKRISRKAREYLGARKLKTGKLPVVLGPLSTFYFLRALAHSLNAEDIQRGRSFFCNLLEKKIASEIFTLADDGLQKGGLYSSSYDGEGTPRRRLPLFQEGYLLNYLHNSYTAGKTGKESTGHATFGGGIAPTNLILQRGTRTLKEIIGSLREGIYLEFSSLSPHPVTGDISQPVDFGFKIEKGEITYPLKNVMIGENFLRILSRIEEISSDYRSIPGNPVPGILIGSVFVSSGL